MAETHGESQASEVIGDDKATSYEDLAHQARYALRHYAGSCLRYYRRRQRLFDWADKLTKIITIAVATTFLADLLTIRPVAWCLAFLTLLDLIVGYGDRRNMHQRAGDMSAELFESIESTPLDQVTTEKAAVWGGMYARLLAFVPPTLECLKRICEREQFIADGNPKHADVHCPQVSKMRAFFANLF